MTTTVNWLSDDKTCILIEFKDRVTWHEFHTSISQAHQMIGTVPHTVHLIIQDHAGLPPGNPMVHFSSAIQRQPANSGKVIVIPIEGKSAVTSFVKQLASIFSKVFPSNSSVVFVKSLAEAQELVRQTVKAAQ